MYCIYKQSGIFSLNKNENKEKIYCALIEFVLIMAIQIRNLTRQYLAYHYHHLIQQIN